MLFWQFNFLQFSEVINFKQKEEEQELVWIHHLSIGTACLIGARTETANIH